MHERVTQLNTFIGTLDAQFSLKEQDLNKEKSEFLHNLVEKEYLNE